MNTLRKFLWLALMLLSANVAQAAEPHPFTSGALQQIIAAHGGKPFILSLWSRSCSHCREELIMLGQLMLKQPHLPLVLVSTDTLEESDDIAKTLQGYGLGQVESWVFADPYIERLQFEIDNRWYGELPRTYFYEGNGTHKGYSGRLDMSFVQAWFDKQGVAQR